LRTQELYLPQLVSNCRLNFTYLEIKWVERIYEIIQTGANTTSPTLAAVKFAYLDSEINGNDESKLLFTYKIVQVHYPSKVVVVQVLRITGLAFRH
jgi:hypothetical protein